MSTNRKIIQLTSLYLLIIGIYRDFHILNIEVKNNHFQKFSWRISQFSKHFAYPFANLPSKYFSILL